MSRHMDLPEWHLVIQPKDTIGDKFKRCAINAAYPGRTLASRDVAIWLHLRMDWPSGKVKTRTSVRELAKATRLSTRSVQDALGILMQAKLIQRTSMGQGKRASVEVSAEVAELHVGFYVIDLWPDEAKTVAASATLRPKMGCSSIHHASVAESATECGGIYYDNPIFLSSPQSLASRPAEFESECSRPEVEAALANLSSTSLPHTSMPETNLKNDSSAAGRVVDGTKNKVALATSDYDPTVPIVGFGAETIDWVRRLAKVANPLTLNFAPAHTAIITSAKAHGDGPTKAAIIQMEVAKREGRLKTDDPIRALPGWAKRAAENPAAARKLADEGDAPRVNRRRMFGGGR